MMLLEIIFYSFASVLICASLGVILFKNPVYSAVSLILAFITTGLLWLLLEAEFLAIVLCCYDQSKKDGNRRYLGKP